MKKLSLKTILSCCTVWILSSCTSMYDRHFEQQKYKNEISNQTSSGKLIDYKTPAHDLSNVIVKNIPADQVKITSLAYKHPFGETLERRLRVLGFSISNRLQSKGTPMTFSLEEGKEITTVVVNIGAYRFSRQYRIKDNDTVIAATPISIGRLD